VDPINWRDSRISIQHENYLHINNRLIYYGLLESSILYLIQNPIQNVVLVPLVNDALDCVYPRSAL